MQENIGTQPKTISMIHIVTDMLLDYFTAWTNIYIPVLNMILYFPNRDFLYVASFAHLLFFSGERLMSLSLLFPLLIDRKTGCSLLRITGSN